MNELLQTGERDRELTAEEWKMVDKLVDEMGWPYYKARLALGLGPPSCQDVHAVDERLSNQNTPADKKPRPERSRFDTRTQQAHEASGQGPLTEEQKQTNRDGIAMARAALKKARAA